MLNMLNELLYFQLIHPMLRADDTPAEEKRAQDVLIWAGQVQAKISRVVEGDKALFLGVIYDHWMKYKDPISRTRLGMAIENAPKNDKLLQLLELYDQVAPNLKKLYVHDMEAALDDRARNVEDQRVWNVMIEMKEIIQGAYELNKGKPTPPGQKEPHGGRDAVKHFYRQIQNGMLIMDERTVGGDLRETMPTMVDIHQRNKEEAARGQLLIRTGLPEIDQVIGGMKRGEFWGILGFAGQRKSAAARSIAYRAAMAGKKVLFIPLESTYETEMNIMGVIHANQPGLKHMRSIPITKKMLDTGTLSDQHVSALKHEIIPHFQANCKGALVVKQPPRSTWADLKSIIAMENQNGPIDLIVIDYLALLKMESRDPIGEMNEVIRDAKYLCASLNNGKGTTILTPVQGNRKGNEEAGKNAGQWETSGIHQYSEYEKSLVGCFYIYLDDELSEMNMIKFGVCKSRDSARVPPMIFTIRKCSGEIVQGEDGGSYQQPDDRYCTPDDNDVSPLPSAAARPSGDPSPTPAKVSGPLTSEPMMTAAELRAYLSNHELSNGSVGNAHAPA
jgi:hypothetical protein